MPIPMVAEQDFETHVLRSELPVLVDLYADWCQPCKQLEPILEEVAREVDGKARIVRVDVERSPNLAQAFRVQSIPMMVLFHQGRPVDQQVGLVDKKTIVAMLERVFPREAGEVTPQDLAAMLQAGQVVPVDIRDAGTYGRYRVPGAINVPAEELPARAAELQPTDGRVRVLYGRSTDEAKELVTQLHQSGVNVGYLAGGFLHWEAEGLEVERG
jgi:thioredoxin 1/putative thioredoxin